MRKVLISTRTFGKYTNEPVKYLEKNGFEIVRTLDKEEFSKLVNQVDAVIVGGMPLTGELIEKSSLKIIAKHGVGVDNIDVESATKKGIPVTITKGANSNSVAELTISFIFALSRNIMKAHFELYSNKNWGNFVGIEVMGKTLGLIGLGSIGKEVAKKAIALGMKVIAFDKNLDKNFVEKYGILVSDIDTILRESDFVSIHVPLTNETRHLIDKDRLRLMKKTAFLINTSRGGTISEEDLAEALKNNWIAGAALDVFENEPLKNSPLFECENVILTPHVGAHTFEAIYNMNMMAARSVVDFFNGKIPENIINSEVIDILEKRGFKR